MKNNEKLYEKTKQGSHLVTFFSFSKRYILLLLDSAIELEKQGRWLKDKEDLKFLTSVFLLWIPKQAHNLLLSLCC